MNLLVIGLGKLGLPLCAVLAESGHQVYGVDKSEELIQSLNSEKYFSSEPNLVKLLSKNFSNLRFSTSYDDFMEEIDVIFVIVPTPSDHTGKFSNTILVEALKEVSSKIKNKESKTVIDIVSTVMPGSCEGIIKETIENYSGQKLGSKISLCYNPEFIALGSVINDMQFPDMHLLGSSDDFGGDVVQNVLTSMVLKTVPCKRLNLLEAELVKISVNNYVTMKISFANSLMQVAESLGEIDIDKITSAIGMDTRIGSKYMRAAAPYGGPCFPRDTRAMTYLFSKAQVPWSLSDVTEKLNINHVNFITQKVISRIPPGNRVGIIGISYKSGTPVVEDSPGVAIAHSIHAKGFDLITWDDEDASIPEIAKSYTDFDEFINKADFFVITRPFVNIENLTKKIENINKLHLDLWRQI
jgi:UDPglucose 6-dehydrogenase